MTDTPSTFVRRALLLAVSLVVMLVSSFGTALAYVGETPDLPLERGDSGDGVRQVQLLLTTAGYEPGPIDGIFGPLTETAVEVFQDAENLAITGIVDEATWDALVAAVPDILMERGDRGDDVRTLQQLLTSAGYDAGVIDGIFGPLTESAVEAFQAANDLPVTGLVDQDTWDALNANPPEILMQRGDTGEDVRTLQLLLASAGFNPGPIDGIFGGLTESAVTSFQNAHGLPVTGQVDQATLDELTEVADEPEILFERGDSGPQVEGVQDQLLATGYDPGPVDGIYGPMTEAAVTGINSVHGLPGDGAVTQETLDKLAELLPLANQAYDYGWDPDEGPEQWRELVTEIFAEIGLDEEKCGEGAQADDCLGPHIDDAMIILVCESDGVPMAVNWASGTTGLFQHRPVYWTDRVARAQDLFPTLPSSATPYNPEHNVMVAALLVHESRDALLGYNSLTGPWDDGPQPFGHWDDTSRNCADPPLVVDP